MRKMYFVMLCICGLAACTTGTKEIDIVHWAYAHQVLEQSKDQKVALANVGDVENNGLTIKARGVKLILKNCSYDNDWTDENYYKWSGTLENTHKSYSFTNALGVQRTVPVYEGDCSIKDVKKVDCFSWQTGCIIESKE